MKKVLSGVGLIVIGGLILLGIFRTQEIKDTYIARTVTLSPEVEAVQERLELTDEGSRLFRASQPEILSAEEFNTACHQVSKELTIVLGCYTNQRFFVYDVEDERLSGIKEVTAAHELLHAAYERLSESEKKELRSWLEETAGTIEDVRFQETVELYKNAEPEHVDNELHSILGTEISVLPKELEEHYARYFKNRSKIVSYATTYEATFTDIERQIRTYDDQLQEYATQKEELEASLEQDRSIIEQRRQEMSEQRASGDIAGYNAAVIGFNQLVQSYNTDIATLQSVVQSYNDVVERRNELAMSQRELMQHMDSKYQLLE